MQSDTKVLSMSLHLYSKDIHLPTLTVSTQLVLTVELVESLAQSGRVMASL